MITLYLENTKTDNMNTAVDIDEKTLSVVDRRYGKKKQELFKSILNSFIIDDVNSIQNIHNHDQHMEVLLRDDPKLTLKTMVSPFNDRITVSWLCWTAPDDVCRSFGITMAWIYDDDYVKLLKAHHKDEALAYLLLKGLIKND